MLLLWRTHSTLVFHWGIFYLTYGCRAHVLLLVATYFSLTCTVVDLPCCHRVHLLLSVASYFVLVCTAVGLHLCHHRTFCFRSQRTFVWSARLRWPAFVDRTVLSQVAPTVAGLILITTVPDGILPNTTPSDTVVEVIGTEKHVSVDVITSTAETADSSVTVRTHTNSHRERLKVLLF